MAFMNAIGDADTQRFAAATFDLPAYYSYGSLSNPRWQAMAERLRRRFENLTVDRYDGVHHLVTSHHADPERVAVALRRLWDR